MMRKGVMMNYNRKSRTLRMNYTYHLKFQTNSIVDSISTMANIKALISYIFSDLNQQRQQLVQELDTFYNHAEAYAHKITICLFQQIIFIPRCATMVEIS